MAPPKQNQFWKLRAVNSGPAMLFKSPEVLWNAACEYFQYCIDNPLLSTEYVGKGKKVLIPKMRAFTWSGLELYLDVYSLRDYKTNKKYKQFFPVINKIEKVMWTQKFEGAAAGMLNQAIISRDLGLVDKQSHEGNPDKPIKTELTIKVIDSGPKPASSEKDLDTD